MSKDEIKTAVINSAAEQLRGLLESNYDKIRKAADDSFVDDEGKTDPVAKVSAAIEWDALAEAPTVTVKLGWSARFKDESEATVDPLQAKLGIEEAP
jgi:hypothetical protein